MRILITGARGMLGRTLERRFAARGDQQHDLILTDLPELDITRSRAVDALLREVRPQVVIHAAAMTQVDQCETAPDQAFAVNALGSAHVAVACNRYGARLIAISTDYVFSGQLGRPAHEWDEPAPQTVYGLSKLQGERAIARHCPDHTLVRIAWLYGPGGPSFVHTMCKLGSQSGPPLKVVHDQIGNPTSTDAVADLLLQLISEPIPGIVHGTCAGEATWYDFACAIFQARGLKRPIEPCTTAEFPRPAPRPADSRLEKRVLRLVGRAAMPSWQDTLTRFFREFPDG